MKLGKPLNKKLEKQLNGVFDSSEIIEIEYTVRCTRENDDFKFCNKMKIDKNGTWIKRSVFGKEWWENTKTKETEKIYNY